MTPQEPSPGAPAPSASGFLRANGKVLILLAAFLAALGVLYLTPLREILGHPRDISVRMKALGWWAPIVFTAGGALLIATGVPRLLICATGGLAFGLLWGLVWSQAASLLGSYGTFLFVRWAGRDFVLRKWPALQRYEERLRRGGILSVFLIKQAPINSMALNSLLAITRISHFEFLAGTFLGMLPQGVPATLAGASAAQKSFGHAAVYIGLAILLLLIAGLGLAGLSRRRMSARGARPGPESAS